MLTLLMLRGCWWNINRKKNEQRIVKLYLVLFFLFFSLHGRLSIVARKRGWKLLQVIKWIHTLRSCSTDCLKVQDYCLLYGRLSIVVDTVKPPISKLSLFEYPEIASYYPDVFLSKQCLVTTYTSLCILFTDYYMYIFIYMLLYIIYTHMENIIAHFSSYFYV